MQAIKFFVITATLTVTIHSCDTTSNKEKTADDLKQELKVKEQINPTQYLSVSASLKENITQKPNLFHHTKTDGYVLSGAVKNSSTVAKFKDVVVEIIYLSETGTEIKSEQYVMYKFLNQSSSTDFEYKVYPPASFKDFSINVKTAIPVN